MDDLGHATFSLLLAPCSLRLQQFKTRDQQHRSHLGAGRTRHQAGEPGLEAARPTHDTVEKLLGPGAFLRLEIGGQAFQHGVHAFGIAPASARRARRPQPTRSE